MTSEKCAGHMDDSEPEYIVTRRKEVLFYVSGLVVLTLLLNGTMINVFYSKVDPYPTTARDRWERKKNLSAVTAALERNVRSKMERLLNEDWLYCEVRPGGEQHHSAPRSQLLSFSIHVLLSGYGWYRRTHL
jgi:hypothetical protein